MNKKSTIGKYPAATEYKFLFECCRAAFAGGTVQYPYNVRGKELLEIIQHHKLIPQIYPILRDHCENVPNNVLQEFKRLFKNHNLHILNLTGELVRLSKIFADRDIPWLSIKGPALAVQLYGDVAARQAHDIDILIRENDLDRTINCLIQVGYVPVYHPAGFNPTQNRFWRKYYKDAFFTHSSRNIHVELHWRIVTDNRIFGGIDFFGNSRAVIIGGHKIPVPDRLSNILYLCYHGGHHAWRRLFWLWDMAAVIGNATPEQTGEIAEKARQYGLSEILGQTALLAEMLFGVIPPMGLKNIAVSPGITEMALRFILDQKMPALSQQWREFIYHRKILPFRDLKSTLAVALVNPLHWKTIPLPEKLFFLYYILRPVAVVIRKMKNNR